MDYTALLVLEDGTHFYGYSFGAQGEVFGEAVFNTSMAGYQEILTDPSYMRQIVTMTYPMIGNYGIHHDEAESGGIKVAGFVVREYCKTLSSSDPEVISLGEYLMQYGIPAIEGIDTRRLTKHLREKGAMRAALSTTNLDKDSLLSRVLQSPSMSGLDLTGEATSGEVRDYGNEKEARFRVAALDYGIKTNILRHLTARGCFVRVFPATTPPQEVLAMEPDGIFVSNGPGDPDAARYAVDNLRHLLGKKPIFGICLGHQLLSLALGGRTYKLKFGHRGGNHPVKNLESGAIEISAQNHGFCVDPESLGDDVRITHINLNDTTVEGIAHTRIPLLSVQYHPENAPGPHDSEYIFQQFLRLMETNAPLVPSN